MEPKHRDYLCWCGLDEHSEETDMANKELKGIILKEERNSFGDKIVTVQFFDGRTEVFTAYEGEHGELDQKIQDLLGGK